MIHMLSRMRYFNPSISSLELSWVIFHLKLSLRFVAIYGAYKGPKLFFILPVKYFLVSLFLSIQFFFPWVAGCHLIIWDVFHKTISSVFFSLLVFQQLRSTRLLRMPSQALLWHKMAFSSPFSYLNYLSSILLFRGIVMLLFSTHHLVLSKIIFFSCLSI